MSESLSNRLMAKSAGVVTWAVVSYFVIWIVLNDPARYMALLEPVAALLLGYLVCMLVVTSSRFSLMQQRIAHALQLLTVAVLAYLLPIDFLPIYSIIWIALVADLYPWRVCLALLVLQAVGWWCLLSYHWLDAGALLSVSLYSTFHVFALMTSSAARSAEAARDKAESLNRELVATQHLLSEASRQSERTRIARDLHDLVGHHLTALSIHLQIAEHQAEGEAQARIAQSRSLARLLLADVRDAVSSLREQGQLDLRRSLELLVDNVPRLDITLAIEANVSIEDVDVADAMIRCVQESLTNTLRHGKATRSWVSVTQDAQGVHVEIRDNGGLSDPALQEGNGLTGMRERVLKVGGRLSIEGAADRFSVNAYFPVAA
ncbi:MAG: sensor histidine kinase [Pseudomonadota bacterium]